MMTQFSDSYVCGTSTVPLLHKTIGTALRETAASHPDRDALIVVHQDIRWNWKELDARVDRLAAGLLGLGLERGDRVGIWAPNCAEWILTQLATARAGLILVSINPAYRTAEVEHALRLVEVRALITAERFKSSDYVAMLGEIAPEIKGSDATTLQLAALPDLQWVIQMGAPRWPSLIAFDLLAASDAGALEPETLDPDDPVNIQFTSGTTGLPKGATLTHNNIVNNGFFVGEMMAFTAADRLCIPVPLYHCFGMVMAVLNCMTHGSTMIFPTEAFDPGAVLKTVEAERCTALFGVPTMFIAELAHPSFEQFDLSTLRTGIMAGAPCPEEVMNQVLDKMHMRDITICYGMTETSPVSFQTRLDHDIATRVSTVGSVHPFIEAKVVDADGAILPRGEAGELLVRGYSVMRGYWAQPDKTRESIDAAGWMHTGDLAVIQDDGNARIVGRLKDMIIRGGENIYPAEIENFLLGHPDIIDACVFGMPNDKWGEEVCAWVRTNREISLDEVRDYCTGRIAHFKVPTHLRCVSEFPMTVTGKVRKIEMREFEGRMRALDSVGNDKDRSR